MELTKENVALLAACGVLTGTIFSNVITFLIHRSKQKDDWVKENKRKRIQKGEELYKNLVKWKMAVFGSHMLWVDCIRSGGSGNELNEKIIERAKEYPDESGILEFNSILAGVYFPEFSERIRLAQNELSPANKIYFSIARDEKLKDTQGAVVKILDAGRDFDLAVDKILKELSIFISELSKV